jgi:hypothetical protein
MFALAARSAVSPRSKVGVSSLYKTEPVTLGAASSIYAFTSQMDLFQPCPKSIRIAREEMAMLLNAYFPGKHHRAFQDWPFIKRLL